MASKKQAVKKLPPALRVRLEAYVTLWKARLLMDQWRVYLEYRDHYDAEPGEEVADDRDSPLAHTEARYAYSKMTIAIYPNFMMQEPVEQEKTIVHEMIHGLLDGMNELINLGQDGKLVTYDHFHAVVEQATEHLATVMMRVRAWPERLSG